MKGSASGSRAGTIAYWALAVLFVGFGFLALFSFGGPFLLTGMAMLIVGPWRHRAAVLWPVLVGVWSFVVGYILAAPLGCTSTAVPAIGGSPPPVGHTTCSNLLGIDYSGITPYNPSLLPAFVAALLAAVIGVVVTRYLLARRRPAAV